MVLDNKTLQFLITFLGSFVGQLAVRMGSLSGSLDKWWLLIPPLSVPPLSIIPAYLISSGKVAEGYGGTPYDSYMIIPIIGSILMENIIEKRFKETGPNGAILKYIINFMCFGLALYLRDVDKCVINTSTVKPSTVNPSTVKPSIGIQPTSTKSTIGGSKTKKEKIHNENFKQLDKLIEKFNEKNNDVSYSKIITNTILVCTVLPIIPYIVLRIPYFNSLMTTIGQMSPYLALFSDAIIRMLSISMVYMFLNMYNGRNIDKSCNDVYKINSLFGILVISIVSNLFLANRADLIPYNAAELSPSSN